MKGVTAMSKVEIERLSKRMEHLEKEIYEIYSLLENTKLDKHVYTVAQTAQILGITPQAVYAQIERGEIGAIKLGHIKIPGYEIKRVLGYGVTT